MLQWAMAGIGELAQIPKVLSLIWSATRYRTVIWLILLILQGLIPVAIVHLVRYVVDSLTAGGAGEIVISWALLAPVAALGGMMVLGEFFREALAWTRTQQTELVEDHIKGLIHDKAMAINIGLLDTVEFQNRLHRACSEASLRPLAMLENLGSLIQNSVTLVGMAALLIPYGYWLPIALIAGSIPALYVVLRIASQHHQWWRQTTTDRRWTRYFDTALIDRSFAEEVRQFQLGSFFRDSYRTLRSRLRDERMSLATRELAMKLLAGLLGLLLSGAVLVWMIWRVTRGFATLGDLTLFYQVFTRGQGLMKNLLGSVGQIFGNLFYVKDLFDFLQLTPAIENPDKPVPVPRNVQHGIRFDNVSFSYPESDRTVLQDLDLFIPANKVTAIVGSNGSGKSTIFKLICRLYDVDEGSIQVDGTDIRKFRSDELTTLVTVLFQWPVRYQATARANIEYGDIGRAKNDLALYRAAEAAEAHKIVSSLPDGYRTLLGKGYGDGVELSGGQWQRLALARAYFRESPILLLDEPTSFMDSWAEIDWLKRLRSIHQDRTLVIITHRLTTAMVADCIYLLEEGKVIETGTHEELAAAGGLYARSWWSQVGQVGTADAEQDVLAAGFSLEKGRREKGE